VIVNWNAPVTDNGAPITAYKVYIRHSDLNNYSLMLSQCDGSNSTVFAAKQCTISFSALMQAPFALQPGTSIFAKVAAVNLIGESYLS